MANKRGSLEFGSDNYMLFIVANDPESDGYDEGSHMMEWKSSPAAMAKALRDAADWLDKHQADRIVVDID